MTKLERGGASSCSESLLMLLAAAGVSVGSVRVGTVVLVNELDCICLKYLPEQAWEHCWALCCWITRAVSLLVDLGVLPLPLRLRAGGEALPERV